MISENIDSNFLKINKINLKNVQKCLKILKVYDFKTKVKISSEKITFNIFSKHLKNILSSHKNVTHFLMFPNFINKTI